MSNWVAKISEKNYFNWSYVPTKSNPADLGSKGCQLNKLLGFWCHSPEWLGDSKHWPEQPAITSSEDSEVKGGRKEMKWMVATTTIFQTLVNNLLCKFILNNTLRILSWVNHFVKNCRKVKRTGLLTTEEVLLQKSFVIEREQSQ